MSWSKLSPRERDVVAGIVQGLDREDAAHALGISSRTYDTHRARALLKLGARNNVHLTLLAIRDGFASMHDASTQEV